MTPDPFTAYPARGWLRFSAGIAFMIGGLVAAFAVFMTTQGIDLFDLRFISVLFLITPPVLLVSGALLWRVPYTKRGWDVVLLDRVVIERVAQA